MNATVYVQRDQPPGVPPLELTGERTLPDVPEENYWFRRHLAVYEWIAGRVGGTATALTPNCKPCPRKRPEPTPPPCRKRARHAAPVAKEP
jgi:hypothetical protein